jgi:hypothetical protein
LVYRNSRLPHHNHDWETPYNTTDKEIIYDIQAEWKEYDKAEYPWVDTFNWRTVNVKPFVLDIWGEALVHEHIDGSPLIVYVNVKVEISS